jgi:hypothetical protein
MRCPGQDKRYWTGEVAFDEPCPRCGSEVEFFKDESSGRCPNCGHRFKNPRVSFDCAKWCAYAEECLGFVPERDPSPVNPGEGALAGRLIRAVQDEYAPDQVRVARALSTFQYAKELLSAEGGDPRIVLAAAVLLEAVSDRSTEGDCASEAKRILEEIGLDADTIACICNLLRCEWSGKDLDTVESRIVSDARSLATLAIARGAGDRESIGSLMAPKVRTEAGKRKVQALTYPESGGDS